MKPNAYIVTQGPMENTVTEFWRMVWQEKACCIVMLTKTFDFIKVGRSIRAFCRFNWKERGKEIDVGSILYSQGLTRAVPLVVDWIRSLDTRGTRDSQEEGRASGGDVRLGRNPAMRGASGSMAESRRVDSKNLASDGGEKGEIRTGEKKRKRAASPRYTSPRDT